MRKNAKKVIEAFNAGKKTASVKERPASEGAWASGERSYRNALWTDGETIYSYGMRIAWREDDGTVAIVAREKGPSRTTKGHIDAVRWGLAAQPIEIVAEERMAELRKEEREQEREVCVGNLRLRAIA